MLGRTSGLVAVLLFASTAHAQQDARPDAFCEPPFDAACIPGTQTCSPACRAPVKEGYSADSCCGVAGGAQCLPPHTLASCNDLCSDAYCLPVGFLAPQQAAFLPDCPASEAGPTKCVPDFLFGSFGNVVFKTCTSIAGAEGRCVPRCVTPIQDIIQYLPEDVCTPTEVCAPCFDPRTGASTGACTNGCAPGEQCSTGCDTGPTQPPVVFEPCCLVADAGHHSGTDGGNDDTGMCVPSSVVSSVAPGATSLFSTTGCSTAGYLCVPRNLDLGQLGGFACLAHPMPDAGIGGTGQRRDAGTGAGAGGTTGAGGASSGGRNSGGTTSASAGKSHRDAGLDAGTKPSSTGGDSGCGCRMAGQEPSRRGPAALSLAAVAALFGRNRRRRPSRAPA